MNGIFEELQDAAQDARRALDRQREELMERAEQLEGFARTLEAVDELLDEIREHPEKWWSVRDMAEMCNLSIDQLRRVFFQRTGVKPKIYVDRLKLNKAAEYLVSSKQPISEVAERFGYRDQYHFSRRFKAVMGVSPQRYRNSFTLLQGGK